MPETSGSKSWLSDVGFTQTTEEDKKLLTMYDNTKLQAIGVCPVWGIVRYGMHLTPDRPGRAMALEAGSAMHEVFAWVRLCTLARVSQGAFGFHMVRLFGEDRAITIMKDAGDMLSLDGVKAGAITVLHTSGFYDEPRDKRRTLSNLEECAFAYIDRWRWDQPVWQRNPDDPTSDIGVEIPFDVTATFRLARGVDKKIRFAGKIDGIHQHYDRLHIHENKTAARLNEAWHHSFHTSSQVTGYCIAASVHVGQHINMCDVLGISVPMPRSYEFGGFIRDTFTRRGYHFERWLNWLYESVAVYERYANDPFNAPQFTHSCNRYFRPCSLIPFCDSDSAEQHVALGEMITDEWSPLHGLADKTEALELQ